MTMQQMEAMIAFHVEFMLYELLTGASTLTAHALKSFNPRGDSSASMPPNVGQRAALPAMTLV